MKRFVGVDVGTSSVKAVLVEVASGEVRESAGSSVRYSPNGEPTRDPAKWADAAMEAIGSWDLGEVCAIGFTGQMHALVALDREGTPLGPARLWLDYDGAPALREFVEAHPEIDLLRRTGNVALPDFTLAKWLAFRAQGPVRSSDVSALVGAYDYVRVNMTGGHPLEAMDRNGASGTQYFNPTEGRWDDEIVASADIPFESLPTVQSSLCVAGGVGATAAIIGIGDQAAALRAATPWEQGVASMSLGTSAGLAAVTERKCTSPDWSGSLHLFPIDQDLSMALGTIPMFGPTLSWISTICGCKPPAERLRVLAAREDLPLFFPWLGGRGVPFVAAARGSFAGLSLNTTAEDLVASVYVGLARETGVIVDELRSAGVKVESLVCSGGGAAATVFLELLAGSVDFPVLVNGSEQASAMGAALLAAEATDGTRASIEHTAVAGVEMPPRTEWIEMRRAMAG